MAGNDEKLLFQFHDYPVYIEYAQHELPRDFGQLLTQMRFKEIKESDVSFPRKRGWRKLKITRAGVKASRQIVQTLSSDRLGRENVIPKNYYNVYRFKDIGLIVYSEKFHEWELGVTHFFGESSYNTETRVIINRFLSWALLPLGIVGFWGVPVEDGIVILKQSDALGEAVFVDVDSRDMISIDGKQKVDHRFKMIRLDERVKEKDLPIGSEELMGYLAVHCTHIDTRGIGPQVRYCLKNIVTLAHGVVYPLSEFNPRADIVL